MSPPLSVYLNAIRLLAALAVLVSHWATAIFTDGQYANLKSLWLGTDGVIVFFVLSGLVIAYTADTKDKVIGQFAFNRFTRMYSVLLPAVVLTLVLDYVGATIDPGFYERSWRWDTPEEGQIGTILLFGVDVWFNRERLGTNGPFWSLSYELWYYVLFACVFYLRGAWRVICTGAVTILIGYPILLLMPCWLAGVWVYRRLSCLPESPVLAWGAALVPIVLYMQLQASGLLITLARLPANVFGHAEAAFYFGNAQFALREYVVAALVALHFLGVAALVKNTKPVGDTWIGWAAGATFSLYVTHAPVLHLMKVIAPDHIGLYIPACIMVALVFAWAFERRLGSFRRLLLRLRQMRFRHAG